MTEYIQFDQKSPLKAEIKGETKAEAIEQSKETDAAPLPVLTEPPVKEVKFFSDPKAVKKKTQGSIAAFQIAFTALFCLLYKLAEVFAPELYSNVSAYLGRLFGW